MSLPATQIVPESGSSSFVSRRRNVDFPEPDGPTRKTNSPLAMSTEQSRSATVVPLYDLVTFSSLIMGSEARHERWERWRPRSGYQPKAQICDMARRPDPEPNCEQKWGVPSHTSAHSSC